MTASRWFNNPFIPHGLQQHIGGSQPVVNSGGFSQGQVLPQPGPMAQNPGMGLFQPPQSPVQPPQQPPAPQGASPGPMALSVGPSGFGNHAAPQQQAMQPPPPMPPPRPADLGGQQQPPQPPPFGGLAQLPGAPMWVSNPMGGAKPLPDGMQLASQPPGAPSADGQKNPGDGLNAFAQSGAMDSFKMADDSSMANLMKLLSMGGLG